MTPSDAGPPPSPLDWRRIDHWSAAIAAGDIAELRTVFGAKGARGPEIVWRPSLARLASPPQRTVLRYWSDLAGTRAMPAATEIDAVQMRSALGYVNLLDAIEQGEDFRYRVFGSTVAAVSGFDLTGQLASALKASPYIVEFGLASFRAALRRGEPLLTEHGPPATAFTLAWHRLILPLADAEGAVMRLISVAVPMARDGRPVSLRL